MSSARSTLHNVAALYIRQAATFCTNIYIISAADIEQRAVSDGWVQAQVQVSSAREWLKWRSHHPKGVPQPPSHQPTRPRPDCAAHWEGPGRPDCRGGWGRGRGSLCWGEKVKVGNKVGLGGSAWEEPSVLLLPHSHHGRHQKLLSLTFCSSN